MLTPEFCCHFTEAMQEKDKQLTTIMEEKNKLMDELKETVTKEDLLGTVSFSPQLF